MAFAASNRRSIMLVSTLIYIFVSTCKFARAYEYPHLGAAGVVANEYVPKAEEEGDGNNHYFPDHPGVEDTNPGLVFDKALECFNEKQIYSSCHEAYRLTQNGELNVPSEYADQYCNGPCLTETQLVLDCINGALEHFVFYNRATLKDVRETIEAGCSYGPKRGDFNVAEHIETDGVVANMMPSSVLCAFVVMIVGLNVVF